MKIYDSIDVLEEKLTQIIKELDKHTIEQITAYEYLTKSYHSIFK